MPNSIVKVADLAGCAVVAKAMTATGAEPVIHIAAKDSSKVSRPA